MRPRRALVGAVGLVILSLVMSGCLGLFGPKLGEVSGKVTYDDGTPVSGAVVEAGGKTATTGSDGAYKLQEIKHGPQSLVVKVSGSVKSTQQITISKTPLALNVKIGPAPVKTGVISGTVKHANGDPAVGVTVVVDEKPTVSATTDANGKYTLSALDYGTYTLLVKVGGLEEANASVVLNAATATKDFTIPDPDSDPDPDPEMGVISGTVQYEGGDPVVGATVSVVEKLGVSATTNAAGTYALPELEYGVYTLEVTVEGDVVATESVTLGAATMTQNFTLDDPEPETGVISGSVQYESGDPVDGAVVSVVEKPGVSATTNAAGAYTLPELEYGSYTLEVTVDGDVAATESVTLNAPTMTQDFTVDDAVPTLRLVYEEDFSGTGTTPGDYGWSDKAGWTIVDAGTKRWIQGDSSTTSNSFIEIPELAKASKIILEYRNISTRTGSGWGTMIPANDGTKALGGTNYFVFRKWDGLVLRMEGMGGTDLSLGATVPLAQEFTIKLTYDRSAGTIEVLRDGALAYEFDLQPTWVINGDPHVLLNLYINNAAARWTDFKVWVQ